MPGFTDAEDRILKKYISTPLSINLALIRRMMESIWANDAPRIVQNYTDHGEEHSERVAGFVEKLLQVNQNIEFSEHEIYLLLTGVYLHDIGMQCDIAKYPEIKEKAEGLGAKFKEAFTAKMTNGYSLKEQKEIRENHHYLSAAWIDYLYEGKDPVLSHGIKSIPYDLVDDLMDVCKFHSKLSINDCPDCFNFDPNNRKKIIAALLRFADELDISTTRVKLETVKIFNLNPDNSLYWWLHNYTKVIFIGSNRISLSVRLHPEDFKLYGSFIRNDYITNFKNKNQSVLDVLVGQKIPVVIDNNSDIVALSRAEKFPLEITTVLDEKMQKKDLTLSHQIQANRGSLGEGSLNRVAQGEKVMQLIREAYERKLTKLDLSYRQMTRLPSGIGELENLRELDLSYNQLTKLPCEIGEFKNLTTLDLSYNQLTKLPSEIGELESLTEFDLSNNKITQLPSEITELKNLTELDLSHNHLTQLPQKFGKLESLSRLYLSYNQLVQLPAGIEELEKLTKLNLSYNQLTQLPPEIGKLKNLLKLYLSYNNLTQLPSEIRELKNLLKLYLSYNNLTQLPSEIRELKNLIELDLSGNPLILPTEVVSKGVEAIFTYLKQSKTTEHNEAKLILVGNGGVGKTLLAHRLTAGTFGVDEITNGINISKWSISAPDPEESEIKLNIWDFGGQEIYLATHQFFLTTHSIYLLVWNARKTKDDDSIYYWLHTIEAFGGESPIILVMTKMNESDDDLNLKDLKSKFPQIAGYLKIDSKDGRGVYRLIETVRNVAWQLPLMRAKWPESWFKVRQRLEILETNWIPYEEFYEICKSEGLDNENINVLDDYLNDLGVIIHFKDRLTLKNIVILKPEWATGAFYCILSTKSVLYREGVLLHNELSNIWNAEAYPTNIHPQLMDLMNKFELAYELPDKKSYLIPELLPTKAPYIMWDKEDNLCFYYAYDHFLPPGIITRFIVRMHQDIERKENLMPLCWREGVVLNLQNSRALIKIKPTERQIEIRINGANKRGALGAICNELDHINGSIKKIKVIKQIPCNCSEHCHKRYSYEHLLKAEMGNIETIQCHESYESISISSLLDGYKRREERFKEYKAEANQAINVEPTINVNTNININLKIDLLLIQTEFEDLKVEFENLNPKLDSDLNKIQDNLDELSPNSDPEKLAKQLSKLSRFLIKLSDPESEYNKIIKGTQKGVEHAHKLGRTYNKFAQWLAMPQVPDLFFGK
jgi:small GTP-binding protein